VTTLKLYFIEENNKFSLFATIFHDQEYGEEIECLRGSDNSFGPYRCFKWSPAVKALCILALRHAAERESSRKTVFLEGKAGTPASSLDYAISKEPNWLLDMFGITQNGRSIARNLIRRYNPERKRPGPVRLMFDSRKINFSSVEPYLNDEKVSCPEQLKSLAAEIESSFVH